MVDSTERAISNSNIKELYTEQNLALELGIFCLDYSVTWMLADSVQ